MQGKEDIYTLTDALANIHKEAHIYRRSDAHIHRHIHRHVLIQTHKHTCLDDTDTSATPFNKFTRHPRSVSGHLSQKLHAHVWTTHGDE